MRYLVITGASRGIGKAIAQEFLAHGWSIINLSRHACDIAQVKNISLDLAQENWLASSVQAIHDLMVHAEKICVVHNAATHGSDSIHEVTPVSMRRTFEINIVAALKLNQILLPHMNSGSAIIYMGSTLSEKAVKNAASYIISKHAVVGMMRATCQDLDNKNIHTCCVCPGFTDTEMLHEHLGNNLQVLDSIKKMVTARRLIQPSEIATLVLFCANNPVVNGSVLHANLGQVER